MGDNLVYSIGFVLFASLLTWADKFSSIPSLPLFQSPVGFFLSTGTAVERLSV
jgi:hypothetical protein